ISAMNALTMAPARAPQLLRPHAGGHGDAPRDPLPRPAIALVFGLLAVRFLAPVLAAHVLAPAATSGEGASGGGIFSAASLPAAVAFVAGAAVGTLLAPLVNRGLARFFVAFNRVFERVTEAYGRTIERVLRVALVMVAAYVGLLALTYTGFRSVP